MKQSKAGKKSYGKDSEQLLSYQQKKRKATIKRYESNPNFCPICDEKIFYEKRRNRFCSQSCAATHRNQGVVRVVTVNPVECAHCGAIKETRHNKYCDACITANVYSNKIHDTAVAKMDSTRRRILLETREYKCESCGLSEWLGQPIPLELDHIDGNPDNNSETNLRLICPTCHALTDTYKGANSGNSARQKMRRRRYKEGKTY